MGYRSEDVLTIQKTREPPRSHQATTRIPRSPTVRQNSGFDIEKRRRAGAYKTSKRKRAGTQFDVLREHH